MGCSSMTNAELEPFILLGKTAKGAAAGSLITQVLEAPGIFVFGELLDLPNISALEGHIEWGSTLALLKLFAYGTFKDYDSTKFPSLSPAMKKKLRLLTVVTMASRKKILEYSDLLRELEIDNVRELEDLIIEGSNCHVLQGKLDQKRSHFEVDFAKGRDIKREDISQIIDTLTGWCESCDGMLTCLEEQANRANQLKAENNKHKNEIAAKHATLMRAQKNQQMNDSLLQDDPDSRMDVDRGSNNSSVDRRDKKSQNTKSKGGLRGNTKGNFWQK